MKKSILLFSALLFLFSCGNDNLQIHGTWQGVTWEVSGKDSGRDAPAVTFQFNADDTYSVNWGAQKEEGTYRLRGDKLYSTEINKEDDKVEKVVQVEMPTPETLVLLMNRQGDHERLILAKK